LISPPDNRKAATGVTAFFSFFNPKYKSIYTSDNPSLDIIAFPGFLPTIYDLYISFFIFRFSFFTYLPLPQWRKFLRAPGLGVARSL